MRTAAPFRSSLSFLNETEKLSILKVQSAQYQNTLASSLMFYC